MLLTLLAAGLAVAWADFSYPGYLVGKDEKTPLALKLIQRVNSPIYCEELAFTNGEYEPFRLVKGKYVNNKMYWHNGHMYVSFVVVDGDSNSPHGTWLVGYSPGD